MNLQLEKMVYEISRFQGLSFESAISAPVCKWRVGGLTYARKNSVNEAKIFEN